MKHSVLIVDDEAGIRQSLAGVLQDEGYGAESVESGEECLEFLGKNRCDVVLLDIWLPAMDGLQTLERVQALENPPVVIMISGHATIETAVRATKLGAFDFIEKPLSIDKTLLTLRHAFHEIELRAQNRLLREELQGRRRIVGDSVPMKALRQQLALAAPTNGRVLVYGESGTGKELVAHALHRMSARAEQGFTPLGSGSNLTVDVRIVAATNKHLDEEIQRGNFREDLFYRLNVIPFFVPPLRDHAEDVPALSSYFLEDFARAYGRKPKHFSESAMDALTSYRWPGNVRELKNLVERLVIMAGGDRIERRHLPPGMCQDHGRAKASSVSARPAAGGFSSLQEARAAYERDYILRKLEENHGNVSRTAEVLGLERSHLYRKMKALGIAARE